MNSTPQEKLILRKFYKHLGQGVFDVYVWVFPFSRIVVAIHDHSTKVRVFRAEYSSQQEVLDKAGQVCMMATFGVGQ